MPVPVSPTVAPALHGFPSSSPLTDINPPLACAIMSNARFFSNGLPVPNPLT
jgi:hypothetical protein